jgi:hypothetical protein
VPTSDWVPGLTDVGAVLRARTKDDVGNEIGTFTVDTRPTGAEAQLLIQQAVSAVSMVIGADLPSKCWDDARYVSALGAALRAELTYFPEQINTGRSPYPQLKQLYDDTLKQLLTAVEAAGGDTPGGGTPGGPMKPVFAFPSPTWRSPYPSNAWSGSRW